MNTIKRMLAWLNKRKGIIAAVSLNLAIFLPAVILTACQPNTFLPVRIPADSGAILDLGTWETLQDAEAGLMEWLTWVEIENMRWDQNLEGPRFVNALIINTRNAYVESMITEEGTVNIAGLLPMFGFGVLGLAIRRPGDKKREDERVKTESKAAYNKGLLTPSPSA